MISTVHKRLRHHSRIAPRPSRNGLSEIHRTNVLYSSCLLGFKNQYNPGMVVRNASQSLQDWQCVALHAALSGTQASKCECGAQRLSHRACPSCGKYNGKVIIDIVARAKRDQLRAKRKQTALRESGQESGQKETKDT